LKSSSVDLKVRSTGERSQTPLADAVDAALGSFEAAP